jgi:hypothetical protein
MSELRVISLEEIKAKAEGTIVEISDWIPGKKISVRVKAIDMTPHILKIDKLPNILKNSATEVFNGKQMSDKQIADFTNSIDQDSFSKMMPIIDGIVKEVLVEPKFDDIQAVYPLTLVQKMELFRIAMGGMEKLDSFR